MIKKKKLNAKLSLKTESMRLLTYAKLVTGAKPPESSWECVTRECTPVFCPTASGMCP